MLKNTIRLRALDKIKKPSEAYRRILERYARAYADMELIGGASPLPDRAGDFSAKIFFLCSFIQAKD